MVEGARTHIQSDRMPLFNIGDWVTFQYGSRRAWAQIVEDRGQIGVNRRRLYRILIGDRSGESTSFEMPEADLAAVHPDRSGVIEDLKGGGLIRMLRSNLGGGRGQPKAWIAYDSDGGWIEDMIGEKEYLGGVAVPFFALHGNRIFTPMKEDVSRFLSNLGLSRAEAEDVVRSVGTAP